MQYYFRCCFYPLYHITQGGINKAFIFVTLLLISTQIKKINLNMLKIFVPTILIIFIGTFSVLRSGLFHASAYVHDLMIPLFLLILGLIFYKQRSLSIHFERLFFIYLFYTIEQIRREGIIYSLQSRKPKLKVVEI
jgi:hypothetical protein